MTNIEVLEINYNNVKNDFKNNNVDLYVAKIELESIYAKLNNIINDQKNLGLLDIKAIDLISATIGLLEEVKHEITTQEKEEFLINNI